MINLSSQQQQANNWQEVLPDLTSMLDILFILIVFFMLTLGTVYQSLDLILPSSITEELPNEDLGKKILLEIGYERYALEGKPIEEFSALKREITIAIKNKPEHELIIASDKSIPIEKLLMVLTYLQSQGIQAANILMKNEDP
jgi:biopolymer transport protein ExbD